MCSSSRFILRNHVKDLAEMISKLPNNDEIPTNEIPNKITYKILVMIKGAERFFAKFPRQDIDIPKQQFDNIQEFLTKNTALTYQKFLKIFNKFKPTQDIKIRRKINPAHYLARAVQDLKKSEIKTYRCCCITHKNHHALSRHVWHYHPEAYPGRSKHIITKSKRKNRRHRPLRPRVELNKSETKEVDHKATGKTYQRQIKTMPVKIDEEVEKLKEQISVNDQKLDEPAKIDLSEDEIDTSLLQIPQNLGDDWIG